VLDRWERVKSFFESLAGLGPSERLARLRDLGDEELATEIRELLDHYDAAGSQFLVSTIGSPPRVDPPDGFVYAPGTVLANRFSILRPLGRGGMGEVYEAEDAGLGDRVAIKCIHRGAANRVETEQLFRREIHIARQITHRNVCRVHDLFLHVDRGVDTILLSMELIEGETLQSRLLREGPLSLASAEPLIRQLLAGLAAAHDCGVIHRDLKPGNLMLTGDGRGNPERLVIMDFGLARRFQAPEPGASGARCIFGTFEYMAPEQLLGESLPGSDIYSLGLILFEMVTGKKPFEGDPLMQAMRRLVDPPRRPRELNPLLPASWERVILQCLEREPAKRFQAPREVALALGTGAPAAGTTPLPLRRRAQLGLAASLVLLAGLAAAPFLLRHLDDSTSGNVRIALAPVTTGGGLTMYSALSDDGRWLAYASDRDTQANLQLWIQKPQDEESRRRLTGDTFDVSYPAFSPDGRRLVFRWERDRGALYQLTVPDGQPKLLVPEGIEGRYSPDGTQVVYWTGEQAEHPVVPGSILLIPAAGGDSRRLVPQFYSARRPVWLPDGRHILFEAAKSPGLPFEVAADWYVLDLNSGATVATGAGAGLRQAGLRVYNGLGGFRGDSLFFSARTESSANVYRYRFDMRTYHVKGKPEQLTYTTQLLDSPSVARNGALAVADLTGQLNIWEFRFSGGKPDSERKLTDSLQYDSHPTISADGTRVAFTRTLGPERQVWIRDAAGEKPLVTSRDEKYWPVIRPDGSEIVYSAGAERSILAVPAGGGTPTQICAGCGDPTGWANASHRLLVASGQPSHIVLLDRDTGARRTILAGTSDLAEAQFSPDDRWVAFRETLRADRSRIVLAPLRDKPAEPASWVPLTDGEAWNDKPHWSADGKTVYFVSSRDGFLCLWEAAARRSRQEPMAAARALRHFHSHTFTIGEVSRAVFNFAIGGGVMVIDPASIRGNIWMGQVPVAH